MTRSHDAVTQSQFGPRAAAYVQSAVHSSGPDLEALEAIAAKARPARALDLGCGGGHVAYRLAAHAREVVASDLSPEMLAAVAATAEARGLGNIRTCEAPAERLPFEDGAFDFLACRFSAHHWRDFPAGLAEARRVVRRGATAVFIDGIAPGAALADTHLQAVELLRDTSHVRDYTIAEWTGTAERAGFTVQAVRRHRLRMEFQSWVERMRTPAPLVAAIRALQAAASRDVRDHFAIEPDGSFMLDVMLLEAVA
jgi:ubiquinone/menaquinone biosynthesis C-methylase UbiE